MLQCICPYCKRDFNLTRIQILGGRMDALHETDFFPNALQDLGRDVIREAQKSERKILSLMELAYRRGKDGFDLDDTTETISNLMVGWE